MRTRAPTLRHIAQHMERNTGGTRMLSQPVTLRDKVGTRQIGSHLCLLNQRTQEAWVFSGVSAQLWEELRFGLTPAAIAQNLALRVKVPLAKAEAAVKQFLHQLWRYGIV